MVELLERLGGPIECLSSLEPSPKALGDFLPSDALECLGAPRHRRLVWPGWPGCWKHASHQLHFVLQRREQVDEQPPPAGRVTKCRRTDQPRDTAMGDHTQSLR